MDIKTFNCDNLTSFQMFYSLVMVRGKRRVFIGLFPYEDRASSVAASINWGGFSPEIKQVKQVKQKSRTSKGRIKI